MEPAPKRVCVQKQPKRLLELTAVSTAESIEQYLDIEKLEIPTTLIRLLQTIWKNVKTIQSYTRKQKEIRSDLLKLWRLNENDLAKCDQRRLNLIQPLEPLYWTFDILNMSRSDEAQLSFGCDWQDHRSKPQCVLYRIYRYRNILKRPKLYALCSRCTLSKSLNDDSRPRQLICSEISLHLHHSGDRISEIISDTEYRCDNCLEMMFDMDDMEGEYGCTCYNCIASENYVEWDCPFLDTDFDGSFDTYGPTNVRE